jgi:tetratricopeptide (TPR) repeat protein
MIAIIKRHRFCVLGLMGALVASNLFGSIEATNLMTTALNHRNKGNLKRATELLQQALNKADGAKYRKMAMFMLGDCYIEREMYAEAIGVYARILEQSPTIDEKSEAFFCLIKSHSFLGNDGKVEAIYKRMNAEAPRGAYAEITRTFYSNITGKAVEAPKAAPKPVATVAKVAAKPAPKTVSKPATPAVSKGVTSSSAKTASTQGAKSGVRPAAAREAAKHNSKPAKGQRAQSIDSKNADILREILTVPALSDAKKDELIGRILVLQDQLQKRGEMAQGSDELLFELANSTYEFGEHLEACKTYDKILHNHQGSSYVERAYYEAIRLRAILGIHDAAVSWANAFLNGFGSSVYTAKVRALKEYSESGGRLVVKQSGTQTPLNVQITDKNTMLKDKKYLSATKLMKDGKYEAAQKGFMELSKTYGEIPQLWWDVALVNVQMEDFRAASTAINRMLRLEPDNEDANSLSGYIHYRLEDYEKAASAYENTKESSGRGVNFYDAKGAAEKMKNSANATQ